MPEKTLAIGGEYKARLAPGRPIPSWRHGLRGPHRRLRRPLRPPVAPDPAPGGRPVGAVARRDRRPVPRRARADRVPRPRRRDRVPAHRGDAGGAEDPAAAPRTGRPRSRRGPPALRGAGPAPRPAARVQDLQGRRRRALGADASRRADDAARRGTGGAVPLARARPARAGPARSAPRRGAAGVRPEARADRRHRSRRADPRQRRRRDRRRTRPAPRDRVCLVP